MQHAKAVSTENDIRSRLVGVLQLLNPKFPTLLI